MKKFPPLEKIYEAWTAIADGRIAMHPDHAEVSSSDGEKQYIVRFDGNKYSSDDNATYWQGYPGYPVIAVMMLQGKLPLDMTEAEKWKNINWTVLNKKFKNNYQAAVAEIEKERGIDPETADNAVRKVMEALMELLIEIKRKI